MGKAIKAVGMASFEVLSWHLPGETKKNHENSQSGHSVPGLRFEPRTYYI
jgi:hypothetical protein